MRVVTRSEDIVRDSIQCRNTHLSCVEHFFLPVSYTHLNQQCTYFGDNKDYAFINVGSSTIVKNLIALYQKLLSSGEYNVDDIQVLTSYKKGDYGQIVICLLYTSMSCRCDTGLLAN